MAAAAMLINTRRQVDCIIQNGKTYCEKIDFSLSQEAALTALAIIIISIFVGQIIANRASSYYPPDWSDRVIGSIFGFVIIAALGGFVALIAKAVGF